MTGKEYFFGQKDKGNGGSIKKQREKAGIRKRNIVIKRKKKMRRRMRMKRKWK